MRSLTQRLWEGGWVSSATLCLPTSRGGTSAAYLAPAAYLLWDLSGTRRASESGKRGGRIRRTAGRSSNGVKDNSPSQRCHPRWHGSPTRAGRGRNPDSLKLRRMIGMNSTDGQDRGRVRANGLLRRYQAGWCEV